MKIILKNTKPNYVAEADVLASAVYLEPLVQFEKGKRYLISAGSGKGKSSLFHFIYGSSKQYSGEIIWEGLEAKDWDQIRQQHLSYLFQDLKLFDELSAWENLQVKNQLTQYCSESKLDFYLESLGLSAHKHQTCKKLSLGQKQRLALIRVLCQPFDFLFLDEPFSHLDQANIEKLSRLIEAELTEREAGLIISSLEPHSSLSIDQHLKL